jgi:hypothetical protein
MRKLKLDPQELKALYPPMSEAFGKMVQSTLYILENGKERPVVKKKISAALIFAVILILATLGVAYALTQSNLLKIMFGGDAQTPEGLEEIVSKPEETVTTPDVKVTLSEYLFDGERLHLFWSIANQTDRQIMVTMSPFMINGMKGDTEIMDVNAEGMPLIQVDNIHGFGQILSGKVNGFALPGSVNYYNRYSNPGEYMEGYHTFVWGETQEITADLYIWELLSVPDPVIPDNILKLLSEYSPSIPDKHRVRGGLFDAKALRGIPTDSSGLCGLNWLMLNDNYDDLSRSVDYCSPEENQKTYESNGWARLISKQPVKFSITLDTKAIKQAKPVKTDFETNDYTLNIKRMAYMPTGGTMVLYTEPKANNPAKNGVIPDGYGFAILDADTKKLLGGPMGLVASGSGPDGYNFEEYTIVLTPVPGKMPQAILIAPVVSNPNWDKNDTSFDPKAALNPDNKSICKYNMENAMKVGLEWQ